MLMTIRKTHRKDAIDLFKLIQMAMGDRSNRGRPFIDIATAIVAKSWAVNVLRDEFYLQVCKQTTDNKSSKSEEAGWELLAIAVTFFPPSGRFFSYLEGYVCRHIKGDESKISQCVVASAPTQCVRYLRLVEAHTHTHGHPAVQVC
jgi:hypothetical protein